MIKRAKTKRNIISILSAVLGVVFALIVGVTYCVTSLQLTYDKTPYSTSAYLGNQQYHLINDTTDNPIPFGEGTHNFEVALQYSIDYNFDVRLDYELVWSNGSDASNVILNFANRDNIIYDEDYIFLANSTTKGSGKVAFITGVEFVDINNSTYYGQTLQIKINAVKIYKEQTSYNLANHVLTNGIQSSLAAQTWINYKNRANSTSNYVLMYNQRRNYESGVPYPGLKTAYKKPVVTTKVDETSITEVSGSTWLGGNKSYAGVGMYVVSGTSPLKLQVEVAAIWREKKKDSSIEDVDKNSSFISEDSIKLNYSSEWEHSSWDDAKLWETRTLTFEIPAKTACYLNILDNIEVTSASRLVTNKYDAYRAVVNSIKINPGLTTTIENVVQNLQTNFEYTESSADFIQMKTIENNTLVEETSSTFAKEQGNNIVSIINSSIYSNNLYSVNISDSSSQTFNTSVSAVNNTEVTQKASVSYALKYYISNGNTDLKDSTGNRADELITASYTSENAFRDELYYAYSVDATSRLLNISNFETEIIVAPYSSVDLVNIYSIDSLLQSDIATKFKVGDATVYYDVWTYLEVKVTKAVEVEESTTTDDGGYYSENDFLTVESIVGKTNITVNGKDVSVTTVTLKVKNNTNKIIKGVTISSVTVKELKNEEYGKLDDSGKPIPVGNKPNDWDSSYWKYYSLETDGSFSQITSSTLNNNEWPSNIYLKSQTYETLVTVKSGGFEKNNTTNTFTNNSLVLLPGESEIFATATATMANTGSIIVSGVADTQSVKGLTEVEVVNKGTVNAYIINGSETSYYLKFVGDLETKLEEFVDSDETVTIGTGEDAKEIETKNNHYIGIFRPGQIINIRMTSYYGIELIPIESEGIFLETTLSNWDADAILAMKNLFGIE